MNQVPSFGPADPQRAVLVLIAGCLALRLALAAIIGLGSDEIYTVAVSRTLSLSYFDHPPLHQWITHVTAAVLGEGRQVRLPFIVLFAGTSWLLYVLTARLFDKVAGFWAVVTLNLAGFFTLSAGSWVVPDGVLLFTLALAAWAVARQFFPHAGERPNPWINWLVAGVALGLAGLAKYHAILAAIGIAFWLVTRPEGRAALRHPAPWLGAALAGALVSPVLIWNAAHGWASFLFQAGRSQGSGFAPWLVPASALAQAGWLLPWVFVPLVAGTWAAHRAGLDRRHGFLMALALPAIVLFTLMPAFGNLGLPHWAMPGWFFLMPLAGVHLANLAALSAAPVRWARRAALGSVAVLALVGSHAATGWLGHLVPGLARNDPTLETFGWDQLPERLQQAGIATEGRILVADSWQNAGRIDVAMAGRNPVLAGTLDPRHHAFVRDQRSLLGRDAVVIARARREQVMRAFLAPHFAEFGAATPIRLGRGGMDEVELVAFAARRFTTPLPWTYGLTR